MATHRKSPNREREQRERVHALVEQRLGSGIICGRCHATLATFADRCEAALDERCPGFNAIDRVRMDAAREVGLV